MFDKNKFKYYVAERKQTLSLVAEYLGINQSTLTRKMNGSSDFSRTELQLIASLLKLDNDQMAEIFFS
ncbi:helix-turn-helix domain-containing protein [uncultured Veillonella sp.]|jgi:transcriptional regulator with XRE-family HTH domain|uniref:helix-turn-helix domain-containing protein n=1 Tax=uncultured Veillonella sp. TaxID=159268 RepID=UPI0025858573|nr:helix-turn-helix domain-containing protein [uncultured Veillonella sp.]